MEMCYGTKKSSYSGHSFSKEKWKRTHRPNPITDRSEKLPIYRGDTTPQRKFRWRDGKGRQLTAGGLLPYDDNGIWAIGEKKTKDGIIEWTDPGGKYKFEDCDIYNTIAREFSEELYYSANISRETILQIKDTQVPVYVNGHQSKPVYICYIVHVDKLEEYGIKLDPELFLDYREKALISNPDVPPEYYSSVELKYIPFENIEEVTLSYRLRRILKYGILSDKLESSGDTLSRSTTPDFSDDVTSEEELCNQETKSKIIEVDTLLIN